MSKNGQICKLENGTLMPKSSKGISATLVMIINQAKLDLKKQKETPLKCQVKALIMGLWQ